jgi:hypothetical protein
MFYDLQAVKVISDCGECADKKYANQTDPYGNCVVSCHFISPVFALKIQKFAVCFNRK